MPAAAPATVAATAPAHFFGGETIDFIARGDGGLGIRIDGELCIFVQRLRHQRCGLRARNERGRTGCNT